jgi:hypothetical protein
VTVAAWDATSSGDATGTPSAGGKAMVWVMAAVSCVVVSVKVVLLETGCADSSLATTIRQANKASCRNWHKNTTVFRIQSLFE